MWTEFYKTVLECIKAQKYSLWSCVAVHRSCIGIPWSFITIPGNCFDIPVRSIAAHQKLCCCPQKLHYSETALPSTEAVLAYPEALLPSLETALPSTGSCVAALVSSSRLTMDNTWLQYSLVRKPVVSHLPGCTDVFTQEARVPICIVYKNCYQIRTANKLVMQSGCKNLLPLHCAPNTFILPCSVHLLEKMKYAQSRPIVLSNDPTCIIKYATTFRIF